METERHVHKGLGRYWYEDVNLLESVGEFTDFYPQRVMLLVCTGEL